MLITIKTSSNKDQFTEMEEAFFLIKKKDYSLGCRMVI